MSFLGALLALVQVLVAYVAPAYLSHKALETHGDLGAHLIYWVVLALVHALEVVGHALFVR